MYAYVGVINLWCDIAVISFRVSGAVISISLTILFSDPPPPKKTEPTVFLTKLLILMFFLFSFTNIIVNFVQYWNHNLPQHVMVNQGKTFCVEAYFCNCSANQFSEKVSMSPCAINKKQDFLTGLRNTESLRTVQNLNYKRLRGSWKSKTFLEIL